MKTKILVTGGLGYIGSHTVVKLIENGYEPIIVDNLSKSTLSVLNNIEDITGVRPEMHICDCSSDRVLINNIFINNDIYAVLHFAAYRNSNESIKHPFTYYKNNVESVYNIVDLAALNGVKYFVFSSTCKVYGHPSLEDLPLTEYSEVTFSKSPYINTKIIGEQMVKDFCYAHNMKGIILRYFNPIGAHPSYKLGEFNINKQNKVLTHIIQYAKGINDSLLIYGDDYSTPDGTCIRDYIDVNDLADAHIKAIEYFEKMDNVIEIFNLGGCNAISIKELITKFEDVNKVKLNYKIGERRFGDAEIMVADCSKANKMLNWKPVTPIEDSLRTAWNWENKTTRT